MTGGLDSVALSGLWIWGVVFFPGCSPGLGWVALSGLVSGFPHAREWRGGCLHPHPSPLLLQRRTFGL